jgi:hypothetical protein
VAIPHLAYRLPRPFGAIKPAHYTELGVARQYLSPHLSADLFVPFFENLGIVLQNVCQSGTGLSW